MIRKCFSALLSILALPSGVALAQSIPDLAGDFGNIVSPDIDAFERVYPEDEGQPPISWMVMPAATYADGTEIIGATLSSQFGVNSESQFSAHVRYLSIDPEGSSSRRDQWRLRGKWKLPSDNDSLSYATLFEYKTLEDTYDEIALKFSGSYEFDSNVSLTLNIGYERRDPDFGASTDDAEFGVGFGYKVSESLRFGVDYTARNDISDDSYSFTASLRKKWLFGVGNDDTYLIVYKYAVN